MKPKFLFCLIGILSLICLGACGSSGGKKDPDLQKAFSFVRYLAGKRFLSRSAFIHFFPDKKPSQFVSYLFSTMGTAEWATTGDPIEEEQMRSVGIPVPPSNVRITNRLISGEEKQLVLKGDDQEMQIIVEAYIKNSNTPLFTEKLSFDPYPATSRK